MGKASCHTRRGTSKPKRLLAVLSICHFVLERLAGVFRIGIEGGSKTSDSLQISGMGFKVRLLCYIFTLYLFLPCNYRNYFYALALPESKRTTGGSWQRSSLSDDITRQFFWTP